MREQDGMSKGSCFIKYSLRESALLAIKNLHAQAYMLNSDVPLEVRFAENKKKQNNSHNNSNNNTNNSNLSAAQPNQGHQPAASAAGRPTPHQMPVSISLYPSLLFPLLKKRKIFSDAL